MQNVLKQSGAKVTGSFEANYRRSLMTLTAFYALTLAIILSVSAGASYSAFSHRIAHRFDHFPPAVMIRVPINADHIPTVADVRNDFIISLIIVNTFLLLLAGILSYLLAEITLRPLKKSYDQQRQFLADASHELRTPLSILQLELENEQPASAGTAQAHKIKSKLEEVGRMSRLVEDLLLLSRLDESTAHEKHLTSIDVSEVLTHLVDRMQPVAKTHDVTLTYTPPTSEKTKITTDEKLFSIAVTNCLKNAILYNKPKGTVTIESMFQEKTCTIRIIDTGIGMKKEELHKIFDRFYRIDESRSRTTGGSGLGLAIVYSSVQHLGGSVTIESEVDEGTTVTITLPRRTS